MIKVRAKQVNLRILKRCIALDVRPVLQYICDICQKSKPVYKIGLESNNPEHEKHTYICFECSPTFIEGQANG